MLGKGFILTPEQAADLIQRDPRNKDVLFPYLNGEDLNSRPDCSASRWVINFHDWSEERARSYPEVFSRVERDVKPERLKNNRKVYRDYWWQYAEKRPAMINAIKGLDRVLVVALVSRTVMPVTVPTGQVFSHMLGVFASTDLAHSALLGSGIHYAWTIARASSLKGDLRYTPSDVYETLPLPPVTIRTEIAGRALDSLRREIMTERRLGLTSLYKIVHDSRDYSNDIRALRDAHREVDEATADAYGWFDLELDHGFYETRQGPRFLISPATGGEMVDRLLELNHAQHKAESLPRGFQGRTVEKMTQRIVEGDVLF
ncbi:type IIL restriction-modification enzyme MmeI [Streptomyces niveus]|uniref:type IIL restriction-modification enzyme MmeI n=1 Tax=Streptomyces niveus TaxID=193462 RepID=UPI00371ACC62